MRAYVAALCVTLGGCCFGGGGLVGGEVVGRVVDDATGEPIVGATLNPYAHSYGRDGAGESVPVFTTDATGAFTMIDMCLYRERAIVVSAPGYATQELPAPFAAGCGYGSRAERVVRLAPAP